MYRKLKKPSKEELERLYLEQRCSKQQIANTLGAHKQTVIAWTHEYGIGNIAKFERHGLPDSLTSVEEQVVVGALLGDGGVYSDSRHAHFKTAQCRAHHGYVRWLHNHLQQWVAKSGIQFVTRDTTVGGRPYVQHIVRFETVRHPVFDAYRKMFYPEGVKVIPENIADFLTPLSLAVWYMDDGCLGHRIQLWTCGFSGEDHRRLQDALYYKFGLETRVGWDNRKDGRSYRYLSVNYSEWFRLCGDEVWKVACMRRKLPKGYYPLGNSSQNSTPNPISDMGDDRVGGA